MKIRFRVKTWWGLMLCVCGPPGLVAGRDAVIADYLRVVTPDRALFWHAFKSLSTVTLDVDGDGKLECLVTFNGVGGRYGSTWEVYAVDGGGHRKLKGPEQGVVFRADRFFVGYVEEVKAHCLLAYHPGKGGGDLEAYLRSGDAMVVRQLPPLDFEKAGDRVIYDKYFRGPDESHAHRSLVEHPVREMKLDELQQESYDLVSIDAARRSRAQVDAAVKGLPAHQQLIQPSWSAPVVPGNKDAERHQVEEGQESR